MSTNTKRLKLTFVKSVDPFRCIHEHIHELILQHLTTSEILNIFLISREWNTMASKSIIFGKKLKFGFSQIPWTNDWSERTLAMLNTNRKFQHVNGHFVYTNVAVKILKLLEESSMASDVKILDVRIDNENGFYGRGPQPESFHFPSIESLNVQHVLSSALKMKLISSTSRLKKLSIDSIMSAGLVSCVNNIKNLKDLELHGLREYLFKQNSLQNAKFFLKSLKFTDSLKLSEEASVNYKEFFKKMSNTMISLYLEHSYSEDVEQVCNQMPKLRRLTMKILREDCSKLHLTANRSIRDFKIFELSENFKKIILNLRHLELLHIEVLSVEDCQWAVKNIKKLKQLSYRTIKKSQQSTFEPSDSEDLRILEKWAKNICKQTNQCFF